MMIETATCSLESVVEVFEVLDSGSFLGDRFSRGRRGITLNNGRRLDWSLPRTAEAEYVISRFSVRDLSDCMIVALKGCLTTFKYKQYQPLDFWQLKRQNFKKRHLP